MSVVLISPKVRELSAMLFHLETAERNHGLDMKRRLQDIETEVKKVVLTHKDSFQKVIFKSKYSDEVMLSVNGGKIFYSESRDSIFVRKDSDDAFDFSSLQPFASYPFRENILRDKEFIENLIAK